MKKISENKKIIWLFSIIAIFILQFFFVGQFGDDVVFSAALDEIPVTEPHCLPLWHF